VFTRVIYGGRISLQIGFIAVAIASFLGITFGLLAGYYGGVVDNLIMRLIDVMLAFPGILLALAIVAILGPNLINAMIAVGISAAPTYARVVRGAVLQTKEQAYIESVKQSGARSWRIIALHILPNILAPIVVIATLGVANAIIAGAALSFLGLGAEPPTPEWGLMLSDGRSYLRHAWWITTFPGIAIMITVLSINLVGDGLRDALDPRMQT
jgi:peptide/nickel transport system permease protein